jgi:hypothetical protein
MKFKIFIIPLIAILILMLSSSSIALAWDEGDTVASDWEQIWKDYADNFTKIIDNYALWNSANWSYSPNAT